MKMTWCGWKSKENCHVLLNQFPGNIHSKTLGCRKIKSVFKDLKWCFNASWGLKGLKTTNIVVLSTLRVNPVSNRYHGTTWHASHIWRARFLSEFLHFINFCHWRRLVDLADVSTPASTSPNITVSCLQTSLYHYAKPKNRICLLCLLGYQRVYLALGKVADAHFHIQEDDL